MRELLAVFLISVMLTALISPETLGTWLQKVDNVRYSNTMCE